MAKICDIVHPDYIALSQYWSKWRTCFNGGYDFIDSYLTLFSKREETDDFARRKAITYAPTHSKAAISRVISAISERLIDIARLSAASSYLRAAQISIDRSGNGMNEFINRYILPELLPIGKVGVFIDRSPIVNGSKADFDTVTPYLYTYHAEDIRSWAYGMDKKLDALLLRETAEVRDSLTGLVTGNQERFRLLRRVKVDSGIVVAQQYYNTKGEEDGGVTFIDLPEIPFVIYELSSGLMVDIADHQIALLNLASSDIAYALQANYPFYTEQRNLHDMMSFLRTTATPDEDEDVDKAGTAKNVRKAKKPEISMGSIHGRSYAQGLERPGFINPSSEPLRVSMEKQDAIQKEIRILLNITIENLASRHASAESKKADDTSLNAGIISIGLELAHGEREIARIWSLYIADKTPIVIKYPTRYSFQSDGDRYTEVDHLVKVLPTIPSLDFQRAVAKQIATVLLTNKVSDTKLDDILREIEDAKIIAIDPEVIRNAVEAQLLSHDTGSKACLYPEGEAAKAQEEHAKRVAEIAASQQVRAPRGVNDLEPDPKETNREEKEASRNTDKDTNTSQKVRGRGKK